MQNSTKHKQIILSNIIKYFNNIKNKNIIIFIFYFILAIIIETNTNYQLLSILNLNAKEQGVLTIIGDEGKKTILIDIVRTPNEKLIGLSNRTSLPDNYGMLFLYTRPTKVSFWMKDTFIALDLVFINKDLFVTSISKNNQPLDLSKIQSKVPIIAVLEVQAGKADSLGITVNTKIYNTILDSVASGIK